MNFQGVLLAAAGGGIGSVLRYWASMSLPFQPDKFAWGTFAVNMAGCLIIGLMTVWLEQPAWRVFAIAGILGGFTTFSGFGLEIFRYLEAGASGRALTYGLLSLTLGTILVLIGKKLAEFIL